MRASLHFETVMSCRGVEILLRNFHLETPDGMLR